MMITVISYFAFAFLCQENSNPENMELLFGQGISNSVKDGMAFVQSKGFVFEANHTWSVPARNRISESDVPTIRRFFRDKKINHFTLECDLYQNKLTVAYMPSIVSANLGLSGSGIDDALVVAALSRNRKIKSLRITGPIGGGCFREIEDKPELKELYIHVEACMPFPSLMIPSMIGANLPTLNSIVGIERHKNLESLTIVSSGLTDRFLVPIARLNNLRSLRIYGNYVRGTTLGELANLRNLSSLSLGRCLLTDGGMGNFPQMPNLVELDLSDNQISDLAVAHLAKSQQPKLSSLFLDRTDVSDAVWKSLGDFHHLKVLTISNTRVTGTGIGVLKKCSNLRALNLRACPLSESGLIEISTLSNLRTLNIDRIPLQEEWLRHLVRMKHLTMFSVKECGLTKDQIRNLRAKMPACEINDWDGTSLHDRGVDLKLTFP